MRKKRIILFILIFVVLLHVIILSLLLQPKKEWSLSEEQKETVMNIAIAYFEENYGTDYFINGNVTISSYAEGGDSSGRRSILIRWRPLLCLQTSRKQGYRFMF